MTKVKGYDVIIERDEGGAYVAHVPELPGCHTQGHSIKKVMKNIVEAIELYLEHVKEKQSSGLLKKKHRSVSGVLDKIKFSSEDPNLSQNIDAVLYGRKRQ